MGLLDATQSDTDAAINVMLTAPQKAVPPSPKTSVWSAPLRALPAAAAEALAGASELVTGFGQVMGATGTANAGGMFSLPNPTERTDIERAATQNEQGIKLRNPVGDTLRNVANDYRPDPLTASTAENLVFGLTKGLGKGLGYMAAGGPIGGAVMFGADEGLTATDDLQRQGVDGTTAATVGALTGVAAAGQMLLPVAGTGLKSTAALVAAGGPGAFAAQQAATRAILEKANYGKIAEQYDPLDPVGLAVSTLLPAAFGGLHLARMRGADGRFAPEALRPEPEAAPSPLPDGVQQQDVDAAMVHNLTTQQDVRAADPAAPPDVVEQVDAPARPRQEPQQPQPEVKLDDQVAAIRQRAAAVEQASPETAAELQRLRQEANDGTDAELGGSEGHLVQAAAECFLSLAR